MDPEVLQQRVETQICNQQSFATENEGERQVVVAVYRGKVIGTFAMATYVNASSKYAKLYSLLARLAREE